MARITLSKPRKKIAKRQLELRERLWPEIEAKDLWSRELYNGFTTIPKSMPLMMSIMDDLAGAPVSTTYLELWCRTFDEAFVTLSKPRETAFHSGFTTQRGERTWKERLKALDELGFIKLKEGPSGPFSYALLLNPYQIIKRHHELKTPGLREDKYNALHERAIEIDDESLSTPSPPPPPPPVFPVPPPLPPSLPPVANPKP